MIDKEELADFIIDKLNEIASHDKKAMHDLIETRVACNEALCNHHSVQVQGDPADDSKSVVGFLGMINGIIGVFDDGLRKDWGLITAVFDDDNGGFVEFVRTRNE